MEFHLAAYPICLSRHERADKLNQSNYILLPSTMLLDLDMGEKSSLFMVRSVVDGRQYCCGVLEFVEDPGICYLPFHIFENLKLAYGGPVVVEKYDCPTGSKIHIQPEETAFLDVDDPKEILEQAISKNYPVLSEDSTILLDYHGREFRIHITKTLPAANIKTINCDIIVEFEEPLDFQAIKQSKEEEATREKQKAAAVPTHDTMRFPGAGHRLGSVKEN